MSQQPLPDPAPPSEDGATEDSPPAPAGQLPSEPTVERSRFSQWLASFGLGELQNPLLTQTRPPAPRRRT